jgi:hypothetical protein
MKRFTSWQDFKRQRAKWRLACVGLLLVCLTIAAAGANSQPGQKSSISGTELPPQEKMFSPWH